LLKELLCTAFYFPDAEPLGTFLNLLLSDPQGGHRQLSGNFAHSAGPLVKI